MGPIQVVVTDSNNLVLEVTPTPSTTVILDRGIAGPPGPAGSGDVNGPASSTDNALVRFDGTTGKLVQNSLGILSDAGVLTGLTGLTSSGSITFSSLTPGRVTYAGTGGLLQDSANLTFNGTTLTANALTTTSTVTLNGGTANGVAYLNGSKVLTTGSALTFDGAKLVNTSGVAGALIQSTDTGGSGSFLRMLGDATFGNLINWTTGTPLRFATSDSAFGSFSEQMRLTSTGLGIGTSSPVGKLNVYGDFSLFNNGTYTGYLGSGTALVSGAGATDFAIRSDSAMVFSAGGATERARITSGGSFQIGSATGSDPRLFVYDNDSTDASIMVRQDGTAPIQIWQGASGSERARISADGNFGIGTSSPAYKLDVSGANAQSIRVTSSNGDLANLVMNSTGNASWSLSSDTVMRFKKDSTEYMRLDSSGNLGIGTSSPSSTLQVGGGSGLKQAYISGGGYDLILGASGGAIFGYSSQAISTVFNTASVPLGIGTNASQPIIFGTSATERMRLDTSGNLGLGVTPSAWGYAGNLELPIYGHLAAAGTQLNIGNNLYYNAGYKYKTSAAAGLYTQNGDSHTWYTAPSGTAGNAISFTQAMTLDASGNLLVGSTTLIATGVSGCAQIESSSNYQLVMRNSGATAGNWWRTCIDSSNTYYILNQSTVGVALGSGSTSWSSVSDERNKAGLQPIQNASDKIAGLRAVTGRYKTDNEGVSRSFLIAQDVQAVLPEAVDVANDDQGTLSLRYTDTIPLLVAAIQEQQVIINAQQAELNQLKARLDAANL